MNSKLLFVELFIGLILSYLSITRYFSGNRNFENLAMGTETTSYQALDKTGASVHIVKLNNSEENPFINAWEERGKRKVILFLGNSQTHSINQKKETEVNYVELLHKNTSFNSVDILCNSLPNASLQEFYLAYHYWKEKLPIKALVIPVFMDDLREDGVRDVFFSNLIDHKFILKDSSDYLNQKINKELRAFWSTTSSSDKIK